jgi:hypothetical protein
VGRAGAEHQAPAVSAFETTILDQVALDACRPLCEPVSVTNQPVCGTPKRKLKNAAQRLPPATGPKVWKFAAHQPGAVLPDRLLLAARSHPRGGAQSRLWFPSDFAIDGIVRISQVGASLWEVARDWRGLWCLAIIYFALAVLSAFLVKRRQVHA